MEELTQKDKLKRARRVALVLATVSTICMMLFVYAYVQSIEAKRSFELAVQLKEQLANQKVKAEQNELIAQQQVLAVRAGPARRARG